MNKTIVLLMLLLVLLTPAIAGDNANLPPPPGVADLYVHITRAGFFDYHDGNGWDVRFDVISGPENPWPKVYQKVIVTASQPGRGNRTYMIVFRANLTRKFELIVVGPVGRDPN